MDITDSTGPKPIERPTRSAFIAGIRAKLETGDKEVNFGNKEILFQTEANHYGFFDTFDPKWPTAAITFPIDANPYNLVDGRIKVGRPEDVIKLYLEDTNTIDTIDNKTFRFVSMTDISLQVEDLDTLDTYEIDSNGGILKRSLTPVSDTPLEDIPERDE